MPVIEVRDLRKVYGRAASPRAIRALSGVTLSVNEGEIFGLLGPNGAGKTTLIKILLGLVHGTSGEARLMGGPAGDPRTRRAVGYLPEGHAFPPYLNGARMLDLMGALSDVDRAARRRRIPELLQRVGMGEWGQVKCGRYSKGMLQRAGLAAALINDPRVVFLDEPTDGVDPIGRREIRNLIRSLRDEGRTVFLNSHLLAEVDQVADRVAILNRGQLVHVGTVKELKEHGIDGDAAARYRIQLFDAAALERASRLAAPLATRATVADNALIVTLAAREGINEIIDVLRRDSLAIAAVVPEEASLEDRFIEIIAAAQQPERKAS